MKNLNKLLVHFLSTAIVGACAEATEEANDWPDAEYGIEADGKDDSFARKTIATVVELAVTGRLTQEQTQEQELAMQQSEGDVMKDPAAPDEGDLVKSDAVQDDGEVDPDSGDQQEPQPDEQRGLANNDSKSEHSENPVASSSSRAKQRDFFPHELYSEDDEDNHDEIAPKQKAKRLKLVKNHVAYLPGQYFFR